MARRKTTKGVSKPSSTKADRYAREAKRRINSFAKKVKL